MREALLKHVCLAYDLRVTRQTYEWPLDRRQRFLLREDVKAPMSVDRNVWPAPRFPLRAPDWTGPLTPLWSHISELCKFIGTIEPPADPVAISLSPEEKSASGTFWRDALETARPAELDESWIFKGFDVADEGMLSGLTNCGYTDHLALAEARVRWASLLNEEHLFNEEDAARSYRHEVTVRVPEHAPFFVFGLWLRTEYPLESCALD